jgi:hypothetical protein
VVVVPVLQTTVVLIRSHHQDDGPKLKLYLLQLRQQPLQRRMFRIGIVRYSNVIIGQSIGDSGGGVGGCCGNGFVA